MGGGGCWPPRCDGDWGDGGALKAEGAAGVEAGFPDVKADTKGDAKGDLQHRYPFLTLCKMFETIQAKKVPSLHLDRRGAMLQAYPKLPNLDPPCVTWFC